MTIFNIKLLFLVSLKDIYSNEATFSNGVLIPPFNLDYHGTSNIEYPQEYLEDIQNQMLINNNNLNENSLNINTRVVSDDYGPYNHIYNEKKSQYAQMISDGLIQVLKRVENESKKIQNLIKKTQSLIKIMNKNSTQNIIGNKQNILEHLEIVRLYEENNLIKEADLKNRLNKSIEDDNNNDPNDDSNEEIKFPPNLIFLMEKNEKGKKNLAEKITLLSEKFESFNRQQEEIKNCINKYYSYSK